MSDFDVLLFVFLRVIFRFFFVFQLLFSLDQLMQFPS